ncbi:MAG: 30S ribosomal protein S20 [Candidatus Omnitrophica bacterium]|nr:30S ribosomal protein S20 [Candidatus Omnitrophota bacterium]
MPIQKAAFKSVRKDKKRHLRNISIKSRLKTLAKKLDSLIELKRIEDAKKLFRELVKNFDKAVSKKIIHKNTASRKKSRLAKRLNRLFGK